MTDVVAPQPQTWDVDGIIAEAMAILRLADDDVDAPRVDAAATVAVALCDAELDRADIGTPGPAETEAAVFLTVEMYRRKDAPFGVLNAWSVDDIAIRLGSDVMRSVRGMLFPYKARFGVG